MKPTRDTIAIPIPIRTVGVCPSIGEIIHDLIEWVGLRGLSKAAKIINACPKPWIIRTIPTNVFIIPSVIKLIPILQIVYYFINFFVSDKSLFAEASAEA